MLLLLPNAQFIDPCDATLLGSPIGDISSINASISKKTGLLSLMGERLQHIFSQDAILLLRNAFAIPKLLYLLRTSSCFLSTTLQCCDDELWKILCSIMNICLSEAAWTQATLPVRLGGLGIRSAVQLAPSAFLASVHTALRTLSTRSFHHVSFQQTFLQKTKLSLCGHRAINNLFLRTKHLLPKRHGTLQG